MDDVRVQMIRAPRNGKIAGMLEALKRVTVPVYTSVPHPDFLNMQAYPLGEVVKAFGSVYFNNTIAYAIAYAIYIGVKEITLFGVDFTWPNVHMAEQGRGCCEYWLGYAKARGIEVHVCEQSTLLDSRLQKDGNIPLYGYDAYNVSFMEVGDEVVGLRFTERELPTLEEIEERYSHKIGKSERMVDPLFMSFPSQGASAERPDGPQVELELTQ
jgi:hypothetical protein